jgi:hypothetical protein
MTRTEADDALTEALGGKREVVLSIADDGSDFARVTIFVHDEDGNGAPPKTVDAPGATEDDIKLSLDDLLAAVA